MIATLVSDVGRQHIGQDEHLSPDISQPLRVRRMGTLTRRRFAQTASDIERRSSVWSGRVEEEEFGT
jgi:hypothetical protein